MNWFLAAVSLSAGRNMLVLPVNCKNGVACIPASKFFVYSKQLIVFCCS